MYLPRCVNAKGISPVLPKMPVGHEETRTQAGTEVLWELGLRPPRALQILPGPGPQLRAQRIAPYWTKGADVLKATSESVTKSKLESRMHQSLQQNSLYFQTSLTYIIKSWGEDLKKKKGKENQ